MKHKPYDTHYQTLNYFGQPYPGLLSFFQTLSPSLTILDLGCGQGRDALAMAKLGFKVTGVDHSSVGIEQFNQKAKEENLSATGIVDDLYTFPITEEYDVVLMDSIVHFYKKEEEKETQLIQKILRELKPHGIFINCILKGKKGEETLKNIVEGSPDQWNILLDTYTDYPDFHATYHLFAIQKG